MKILGAGGFASIARGYDTTSRVFEERSWWGQKDIREEVHTCWCALFPPAPISALGRKYLE